MKERARRCDDDEGEEFIVAEGASHHPGRAAGFMHALINTLIH